MLTIYCPRCGARPESEFRNGGVAGLLRAFATDAVDDDAFAKYLFERPVDPTLAVAERWCHVGGCGAWFIATRHLSNSTVVGAT
jgi:sarcosine oxidase, subunit delta